MKRDEQKTSNRPAGALLIIYHRTRVRVTTALPRSRKVFVEYCRILFSRREIRRFSAQRRREAVDLYPSRGTSIVGAARRDRAHRVERRRPCVAAGGERARGVAATCCVLGGVPFWRATLVSSRRRARARTANDGEQSEKPPRGNVSSLKSPAAATRNASLSSTVTKPLLRSGTANGTVRNGPRKCRRSFSRTKM